VATVLVVEDDAAIANLVDTNLRKEGHKVVHARSVGEAWQQVNATTIAGAVVDLHLPGVYGWELVRRMRQDQRFKHIPVLIVSADFGEPERMEAEELGCDYLPKPFDLDDFLVKARAMIVEGRRIGREKVRVKLLMDVYEIEGTIHVEAFDRFSEAWEDLLNDERIYIPVTEAVITAIGDGRVVDSPAFVQVNKTQLRAVSSLGAPEPEGDATT
jgi:CheY-like chemotaxis protein